MRYLSSNEDLFILWSTLEIIIVLSTFNITNGVEQNNTPPSNLKLNFKKGEKHFATESSTLYEEANRNLNNLHFGPKSMPYYSNFQGINNNVRNKKTRSIQINRYRVRHNRHKDKVILSRYNDIRWAKNENYKTKSIIYKKNTDITDINNDLFVKTSKIMGNFSSNRIEKEWFEKVNFALENSLPQHTVTENDSTEKLINKLRFMPKIPFYETLKDAALGSNLQTDAKRFFSNKLPLKSSGDEGTLGDVPFSRSRNSKIFNVVEKVRSYHEELLNKVGTFMPLRKNRQPRHFGLPIPNMRIKSFRGQIFENEIQAYDVTDSSPNANSKSQNTNIVLFGEINENLARQIRNCGSYMSVDLLKKFSLDKLLSDDHQKRALIIYINVRQISADSYDISVENIKAILDHAMAVYKAISIFNLYQYEEQDLNKTTESPQNKEKRILLNMNDDILDFCSQSYPDCQVKSNLESTLWGLHQMYKEDQALHFYNTDVFERQFCFSSNVCKSRIQNTYTKSKNIIDTPYRQLKELSNVLCMSPHHRIVEFVLNAPVNLKDLYGSQRNLFITRIDGRKRRISAQTGLVLQDILPVDLKMYDKNRPPKYEGQPTVVYFHVTVLSVDSINEESMTYVADIFLAQSWRDHRLRLPENMTEEYRILDVDWLHNIWRPDCFFKNAKQVTFHEMSVPNHYLWLYHDKTLLYMAKLTLVLSCAMKFETYPHDTQICSMMIESLSHTTHDLVFKWNETDPLVVNPDIELPQLDISRNYTDDCTLTYSTGNFTCLAVVFNLRRRLGYHLFHTYIPSAITVVMSWISFWIKPEAIPARVTLGVTSLLTLATQNQQSQSSLPPVSYIKAIDVWMSSCTVFVFASLLEFGLVNHFMNTDSSGRDSLGYSLDDLTDCEERKLSEDIPINGFRKRSRPRIHSLNPRHPQYVVTRCSGKDIAIYIDKYSRFFFPVSFCILNISYWTTYGSL